MRLNPRLILLAVACICTACVTPHDTRHAAYAPDTAGETRQLKIGIGDQIRLVTTNRDRLSFKVEQVLADRFVGVTVEPHKKEKRPPGLPVEVPYADIAMIEITHVAAKTVAATAGYVILNVGLGMLTPVVVIPASP